MRGKKRSHSESIAPSKAKLGRPAGEGSQCTHLECTNKAQSRGKCRTHTGGGKCSQSECDKQAQYKGLCAAHGGRRICTTPNCDKKVVSKGKCADHGGSRRRSTGSSRETSGSGGLSSLAEAAELPTGLYQEFQTRESMMSLLVNAWPPMAEVTHQIPGDVTESVVL